MASCYTFFMNMIHFYALSFLLCLLFTTLIFSLALRIKNNSIMDIGYGLTFIFTSIILSYLTLTERNLPLTSLLILFLILIWGSRLALRIYKRNKNKEEDFRYAVWRIEWSRHGKFYFIMRSYLQIYVLQAFIISIVLLPFTLSLTGSTLTFLSCVGILLWMIGFFFEAVGDAELDSFIAKSNTHGLRFLTTGLFAYTRHPNYFGESMMWLGLATISFGAGSSFIVYISPLLITTLLLFVSGIPMVEKRWHNDKEWEAYAKKTNAFFPFPSKNT